MRGNMIQTIITFMVIFIVIYLVLTGLYKADTVEINFADSSANYELVGEMQASSKSDFSKEFKFKGVEGGKGQITCHYEYWSFKKAPAIIIKQPVVMKVTELESSAADFALGTVQNAQNEDWLTIDNIEQMPSSTDMTFTVLNGQLPGLAQLYVDDELRAECLPRYTVEEDNSVKTGVYVFESWPQMDRTVTVKFVNMMVPVDPSEMTFDADGRKVTVK